MAAKSKQDHSDETMIADKPKSSKKFIFIAIAAFAVLGIILYIWLHKGQEHTDNASFEAQVVALAPRVSGYATELYIEDNQLVKKGDLLVQIDPTDYMIARDRAKGALLATQAELTRSSTVLNRLRTLDGKARAKQDLDDALAAESAAQAQYDIAKADLAQAEKNLNDTRLGSPIDGRITERSVEKGAYVQPGQRLFSIVGNELWVVANYKETQIEHMKAGQRVDIEVDARPDLELTGKIESIQAGTGSRFSLFPAENATGNFVKIVQRVPVKIILDKQPDPSLGLAPGMSIEPVVHTAD